MRKGNSLVFQGKMKFKIVFLFLASAPLFAVPDEQSGFVEKKDIPTYRERNTQIRNELDETVRDQIQDYIDNRLEDPRDSVYVSVDGGVVTLTGVVAKPREEIDLLDFVRRVRGVTSIVDEITIWEPDDKTMPPINPKGPFEVEYNMLQNPQDDRVWNSNTPIDEMGLKGEIRDKIQEYEDVSFGVFNSDVILEGYVETGDDRKRIERLVKSVRGVRNVENRIKVRNKYPAQSRH